MPKNQGHKDSLYITASEWAHEYGGKKREVITKRRPLAFDCCALSLQPYEDPVCTKNGVMFEILRIMPFIKKHKVNPCDGLPLKFKELVKLNMSKNQEGKWHCPVTFKVFTDNSVMVCVRVSGHVYDYSAVHELNLKPKNFKDLMTDAPFDKDTDLITLQDPNNEALMAARDISNFTHLKTMRDEAAASRAATPASQNIRANPTTAKLFEEIAEGRTQQKKDDAAAKVQAAAKADEELDSIPDLKALRRLKPTVEDLNPGSKQTAAASSYSFTSSAVAVATRTEMRPASVKELREARWKMCRKIGKKGYVQLQTTHGNLNLEVHSDFVPMTSENFLGLCAKGAYDGVAFHRLIPGFMLQGGDTTSGDGRGGESLWAFDPEVLKDTRCGSAAAASGCPFNDEFDSRLVHGGKGMVSMANGGKNSNKAQFFVCFRACRHLDNVHTIFAKVVGGVAALDRLEQEARDEKTDKPKGDVRILKTLVYSNPLEEATTALESLIKERQEARQVDLSKRTVATNAQQRQASVPESEVQRLQREAQFTDRKGWHSKPQPAAGAAAGAAAAVLGPALPSSSVSACRGEGVGKYMGKPATSTTMAALTSSSSTSSSSSSSTPRSSLAAFDEPLDSQSAKKLKRSAGGGGFGDFSGW